ncbi:MAG TPA: ABATE domain-containing protein [Gemmatimonadales bacterium]
MPTPEFPLVGNLLWLDFVNTEPVLDGARVDLLHDVEDLVAWLQTADAPPQPTRPALRGGTSEGRAVFREALALRAALRAGAERLAEGKPPGEELVRAINRVLAERPGYRELVREGKGWVTRVRPVTISARQVLVPIAESAAWLLEHGDPSLVRRCEGSACVLLFYDTTRNRSRRWCSMEGCGSRAKAAAYYRRTRGG